jgi:hypothetical protein
VLCPEGFDPHAALPGADLEWDDWWEQQQDRQRGGETWRPPAPPTCCGKKGAGFSGAGEPLTVSCQLCAESPTWYQWPENREDGRPYQPARPLADA